MLIYVYILILYTLHRYLTTVDANLNPVSATVRVGLAVETVGQAGRPKTITGFQVCSYVYMYYVYIFTIYSLFNCVILSCVYTI